MISMMICKGLFGIRTRKENVRLYLKIYIHHACTFRFYWVMTQQKGCHFWCNLWAKSVRRTTITKFHVFTTLTWTCPFHLQPEVLRQSWKINGRVIYNCVIQLQVSASTLPAKAIICLQRFIDYKRAGRGIKNLKMLIIQQREKAAVHPLV